jgi:hypothetical protein
VLFGVLLVSGLWAAYTEGRPFLFATGNETERFEAIEHGRQALGLSVLSKSYALMDCDEALTSPVMRLQPRPKRLRVAQQCLETVRAVISTNPADGLGEVVGARASALLGDTQGSLLHLDRSFAIAPHESWIAQRRLLVVWQWELMRNAANATAYRKDVALIAGSDEGRQWLAHWYIARPDLREFIIGGLEEASNNDKKAFLTTLGAMARSQSQALRD